MPPRRPPMFTGFLNIDKPAGITSHDVVDAVRRITNQRQVGHTGTLDPFATGVLILALGKATRLSSHLTQADKAYSGAIHFGRATDTYDSEGKITLEASVDHLDEEGIRAAMNHFRGRISQVPPPFSAKKVAGKKLYEYARAGETVEVEPKSIEVQDFVLERWEAPFAHFRVVVSAGGYVRSLAHELGQILGCGAHLSTLARTRVGHIDLSSATDLRHLEAHPEILARKLLPITEALPDIPSVTVPLEAQRRLLHGSVTDIEARGVGMAAAAAKRLFAVDETGHLLALVESAPAGAGVLRMQPKIQFAEI